MLLMADKMQIISTLANTFTAIWQNADCESKGVFVLFLFFNSVATLCHNI
jgi:hypothetical protein